jgi:hypothetical protein
MRKHFALLFIGALAAVGCGESTKKTPPRSFLITTDNATDVSRLTMTTAALTGRHSVVPKGADTNPAHANKCPISKDENKISIKPACKPDLAGAVDCVFTEDYTCPEVTGQIVDTVHMGETSLDFGLKMDGYQEGNAQLGFIKYTGTVSATTTPDGKTAYSSTIAVVARALGATTDTVATSSSDISVTTSETSTELSGSSNLSTPFGPATMALNKVEFGDCKISPKSGTIDLALVGLERAQLRADGCGDVKLVHYVGDKPSSEESMSQAQLISAFGSSISDVTIFRGVTSNTEKSAAKLYPEQWCVPYVAGVSTLLAASITSPTALVTPTTTNPLNECLVFNAPTTTGAKTFAHVVLEDKTGIGAFGDPTKIDVHFFRAGVLLEDFAPIGGANMMIYAQAYTANPLPKAYVTFNLTAAGDLAGTDLTAFCDPSATDNSGYLYCFSRYTFNEVFDHFGVSLVGAAPANLGTFWYAHTFK